MESNILVANLKSFKTQTEAKEWLEAFSKIEKNLLDQKTVIVCPPFTLLELFKSFLSQNQLKVLLGAQDVSPFDEGPYTGEINARQVKEFADFVLIGHSERRKNFGETDEMLNKKVEQSLEHGLIPIYLVSDSLMPIPSTVEIVAYEPLFAIGSGSPDTPENASTVAGQILQKGSYKILYGGSVNSENINSFVSQPNLSGALIGGASLEAQELIKIIQNA